MRPARRPRSSTMWAPTPTGPRPRRPTPPGRPAPPSRSAPPGEATPVSHHVGAYAYRPEALSAYAAWAPGPLEELEGLEQLRFVENGSPVLCVEVEAEGRNFWELNRSGE